MGMGQKSQNAIVTAIGERSTFVVNTMSGRQVGNMDTYSTSQMPAAERDRFLSDRPQYVIWSYGTPIAWVTGDGRQVVSSTRYSVTTSNHQGIVKRAFGSYETA